MSSCSMKCWTATSERCTCPCGGANHGTANPMLGQLLDERRERHGQELYANGSGAVIDADDYLAGINDGLRISAEREGRAIPGRLL